MNAPQQERTPTWYGLFTEEGEESEVVDVMQFFMVGQLAKEQGSAFVFIED